MTEKQMKELATKRVNNLSNGKSSKFQIELDKVKPYIDTMIESEISLVGISKGLKEDLQVDIKTYHIKTFIKNNYEEYYKKKFDKNK